MVCEMFTVVQDRSKFYSYQVFLYLKQEKHMQLVLEMSQLNKDQLGENIYDTIPESCEPPC